MMNKGKKERQKERKKYRKIGACDKLCCPTPWKIMLAVKSQIFKVNCNEK